MNKNSELTVIGWGATASNAAVSPNLQYAAVPYVSPATCRQVPQYAFKLTGNMICAGGEESDACQGDSGGPLIDDGGSADEDTQARGMSFYGLNDVHGCVSLTSAKPRLVEDSM